MIHGLDAAVPPKSAKSTHARLHSWERPFHFIVVEGKLDTFYIHIGHMTHPFVRKSYGRADKRHCVTGNMTDY